MSTESASVLPATASMPLPTFIPSKRRKVQQFRRRRSSESPPPPAAEPTATATTGIPPTEALTPSVSAASTSPEPPASELQKPKPRRPRGRFGLEVTAAPRAQLQSSQPAQPQSGLGTAADQAKSEAAEAEAQALAVVNRFTHQTGQVTDVDKHMMAYVEREMQLRHGIKSANADSDSGRDTDMTGMDPMGEMTDAEAAAIAAGRQPAGKGSYWAPTRPEARGATLGKLHEVDLGEEVKQRNIVRTVQATQKLSDPSSAATTTTATATTAQPTAHRRNRRRRTSADIERDRLVEEVLKESRLDLYPTADADHETGDHADGDEGAADDKIAEKFRREFIDAIMSKRRRRGGGGDAAKKRAGDKKDAGKRPKGPKLGGSRMARAQMREQQMMGQQGGAGRK